MEVPAQLKDRPNWIVWRDEAGRKVPYQANGRKAKSNKPKTWTDFAAASLVAPKYSGLGFVFDGREIFGIDLDGCIDDAGQIQPWSQEILDDFPTYAEISPSGHGIKLFALGTYIGSGKKKAIDAPHCCSKPPGVEVYGNGRYFTVTGRRLDPHPNELRNCQAGLDKLLAKHWPPIPESAQPAAAFTPPPPTDLTERARAYLATIPPAISGKGGSTPTFRAACTLILGFALSPDQAYPLLAEWNLTCDPPWSERELRHKLEGADEQPGDRGWLLDGRGHPGSQVNLDAMLERLDKQAPTPAPAPPPPPPDTSVDESLCDMPGFVGDLAAYIRAVSPYPSRPLSFAFALACLALLTGRKVRTESNLRTNLYIIALAASGSGKNEPRMVIQDLLAAIGMTNAFGENFASGPALEDALIGPRAMLFLTTEIADVLDSAIKTKASSGNMMLSYLLKLHSNAGHTYALRKKAATPHTKRDGPPPPTVIEQPHLVMIGDAVTQIFFNLMTESLQTSGLLPRMLIIQAGNRGYGRDPLLAPLPSPIIERAAWWRNYNPTGSDLEAECPHPRIVTPSEMARKAINQHRRLWDDQHDAANAAGNDARCAVYARAHEHALKLALLYACSENPIDPVINDIAVNWAIEFTAQCTSHMLTALDRHAVENPFDAACQKFLDKLRKAGGTLPHSMLLKRMKIDARAFTNITDALIQRGEIIVPKGETNVRTATIYQLVSP